ncbi:MAG TPA: cytochrome c-type biogenesis protein [Stellaceae bacterium]|nr:cytochrome c-type biogenesis protein [Stellaceae bacterium]
MKALLTLLAFLLLAPLSLERAAFAVEPSERLSDPALEARARALSEELRCLVCQNETIDESSAPLAHDLRVLLRERIAAGDSDAQALKYLTDRYGDFVLLKPPIEPATYLLWFGPIIVLVLAGSGALIYLRKRKGMVPVAPLSEAEEQRIERLLKEEG